jgi:hypothetical protein
MDKQTSHKNGGMAGERREYKKRAGVQLPARHLFNKLGALSYR